MLMTLAMIDGGFTFHFLHRLFLDPCQADTEMERGWVRIMEQMERTWSSLA